MKIKSVILATTLGLCFAQAYAADVEGSTSAVWTNFAPSGADVTGANTPSFTWGIGSPPSELDFKGTTFASALETKFKVGSITYLNGAITGTGADSVDLKLSLNFTTPALGNITGSYGFTLINTPNTGTPDEAADFVNLPSLFSETSFLIGGTEYRVKLTGFENVVGDGFLASDSTQFHVREGGTATADLFAVVTTASPVPEPETYALMLAGLGVVGAMARRRRKA